MILLRSRLMTEPLLLPPFQATFIILRLQPLQTGYHEILLHLQNETDLFDVTSFYVITVLASISVDS